MTQPPSGDWLHMDTLVTNSSGRVSYTIPEAHRLGVGVYPVKMVVRYRPPRGGLGGWGTGGGGGALVGSDGLPPCTQGRPHLCRQLHHRAAQGH